MEDALTDQRRGRQRSVIPQVIAESVARFKTRRELESRIAYLTAKGASEGGADRIAEAFERYLAGLWQVANRTLGAAHPTTRSLLLDVADARDRRGA
jgi:hypothetical protein